MTCDSPCIGVCRLDEIKAFCLGCQRTPSEIAAWSNLTEDGHRHVLAKVKERKAASAFRPATQPNP